MSIEELLKIVNQKSESDLFLIPRDVMFNGNSLCLRDAAAQRLSYYDRFWKETGIETRFEITPDTYTLAGIEVGIMTVSMDNQKLQEYQVNMNTVQ